MRFICLFPLMESQHIFCHKGCFACLSCFLLLNQFFVREALSVCTASFCHVPPHTSFMLGSSRGQHTKLISEYVSITQTNASHIRYDKHCQLILLSPCSTSYGSFRQEAIHPAASNNFCSPLLPTATAEQETLIGYLILHVSSSLPRADFRVE